MSKSKNNNQENMEIGEFLKKVAKEMKKTEKEIQPYIYKFKSNWLDTSNSLKNLSKKEWEELEIPLGLKHKILKHIGINYNMQFRKKEEISSDMFCSMGVIKVNKQSENSYIITSGDKCEKLISQSIFEEGIHKLTIKLLDGYTRLGVGVMKLKPLDVSQQQSQGSQLPTQQSPSYNPQLNDFQSQKSPKDSHLLHSNNDILAKSHSQMKTSSNLNPMASRTGTLQSSTFNPKVLQTATPFISYHMSTGTINYKGQKNIATGKILEQKDTLVMYLDLHFKTLSFGKEDTNGSQFFKGKCSNVSGMFQFFLALEPGQKVQINYKCLY